MSIPAILNPSKILEIYSLYTKSTLTPLVPLNDAMGRKSLDAYKAYSNKLASAPTASYGNKVLARGIYGAQLAARAPATLFLIPEFFAGTGQNPTAKLDLTTQSGREKHIADLVRNPTYTGTAGAFLGAGMVIFITKGAIVGGLIGGAIGLVNVLGKNFMQVEGGAFNGVVKPSASMGALIGAGIGCVLCTFDALMLNSVRLVLAVAKLLVMAPFAAAGFVGGCLYGAVEPRKAEASKETPEAIEMTRLSKGKARAIDDDAAPGDAIEMVDLSSYQSKVPVSLSSLETAGGDESAPSFADKSIGTSTLPASAPQISMPVLGDGTGMLRTASWP